MRPTPSTPNPTYSTVHQLDSIYYGNLNNSYQKDGFGILQTFQFNTYIGNWKNNKTEGLGLAILSSGIVVYANFNRDTIDGLTIIDDGDLLICGIYRNGQYVGVGFQYNYQLKLWKMNRYHKGISIQTIKEQYCDIANNLPKIINVQQSIYFHLYAYAYKQFFPSLQQIVVALELQPGITRYGLIKDEKNMFGPGLIMEGHQIIQAGYYEEGLLHGYGIKTRKNPFASEFGCYHKGRKDGPFMQRDQSQVRYLQYRKGILLKNLPNSQALIIKNQKKYNFNRKDYLSAKNNIPFDEFNRNCIRPQIKDYRQTKNQLSDKKKPLGRTLQSPQKNSPNKRSQFKSNSKLPASNRNFIVGEEKERSSVQIIREKMGHFYGIVTGRRKSKQSSPKKSPTKNMESVNYEDQQIARQQNPFY